MRLRVSILLVAALVLMAANGAIAYDYTYNTGNCSFYGSWTDKSTGDGHGSGDYKYANDSGSGYQSGNYATFNLSCPFGLYDVYAYIPYLNATCTWTVYQVQANRPYDDLIPWQGANSSNDMWVGCNQNTSNGWTHITGSGNAVNGTSYTAGSGNYVWCGGSYNKIVVYATTSTGTFGVCQLGLNRQNQPSGPSISSQPSSASVCSGNSNNFCCSASSSIGTYRNGGQPEYQWYRNGSSVGDNKSSCHSDNTAANYYCIATTAAGTAQTNTVSLTVNSSTSITLNPTNQTCCSGGTGTFTVGASGSSLSYQWYGGSGQIGGATSSSYTTGTAGSYYCVVSGSCGSATSNSATLTVNAATSITSQPSNQTCCSGGTGTFTVGASGTSLGYQWYNSSGQISGATSSSYTTGSAGSYYCIVSGSCGSNQQSNTVSLTVNAPIAITTDVTDTTVCDQTQATFTVAATGTSPTYRWQVSTDGGTTFGDISGATDASYSFTAANADNSNKYQCIISGACGQPVTSAAGTLTVTAAPSIGTNPSDATVCSGSAATFTVAATGTNLTYQWQVSTDGGSTFSDISGATDTSYAFTVAVGDNAKKFQCVVSNGCAPAATSSAATLSVTVGPTITTDPAAQTICSPNTATFTVAATGSDTLTYQWRKNGAAIDGATSTSYTTGDAGSYDCVVTNGCSSATSGAAVLTVNSAPAITTQPTAATVCSGDTATFTVTASGTPAPTYQWQKDGSDIAGATSASYTTGVAGSYGCVVTNSCGTATSDAVSLTVNTPIAITTDVTDTTVCDQTQATFTVAATGTSPTYRWQVSTDGGATFGDISGATDASYSFTAANADSGKKYQCVVSGACGQPVTSAVGTLTVTAAPSIGTNPSDATVCSGSVATFTVAATGTNLVYQWQVSTDGGSTFSDISGATDTSYSFTVAVGDNSKKFQCVVSNGCAPASTSSAATLSVTVGPSITTQPQAATICSGSIATFTAGAIGSDTLTYQWRKNSVAIDGATSTSYATGDAGSYDCVVSNGCGSATTGAAVLTVNTVPTITTQPADQTIYRGDTATFAVAVSGGDLTYQWRKYQWRKDGVDISGATSADLTTGDAGNYECVITNPCGAATSHKATLTILGTLPGSIVGVAKTMPDGTAVTLAAGPVVTRSLGDFFYLEDVNRDAAIRVIPSQPTAIAEGSVASIIGTITTIAGERVISGATVSDIAAGVMPSPLGMAGSNPTIRPVAQGLLVKLWGVAEVAPGATDTFSLRDGTDFLLTVKLYGVTLPTDKAFITIQGVLGQDASGVVLRVNSANDIR